MDDILIDEKKYVSSKQAAKITGYAKDYIGQLCREGRVPARLVGRSWYVLETAIQDHRFGDTAAHTEPKEEVKVAPAAPTLPWTQQSPRYEAAPIEVLPTAHRIPEPVEVTEASDNIQNSWKAWFDRVGQTFQQEAAETPTQDHFEPQVGHQGEVELQSASQSSHEEDVFEEKYEDSEVSVPIHAVYKAPPRELLPRYTEAAASDRAAEIIEVVGTGHTAGRKRGYGFIKSIVLVVALVAASFATLGSGYLDHIIVSASPVHIFSGMSVYNK